MNLQECLNKLGRGKISNLSLCQGGYVKPEHIEKVIDAINEALLRIYTAISIKEDSYVLELEPEKLTYPLKEDVLTLTRVYDDIGQPYSINNPEHRFNVFTSGSNLVLREPIDSKMLTLFYRVKPKELTTEDFEVEIEIPDNLLGALFSYVAYLLHNDMNTEQAVANAQKYLVEYQTIIDGVIQQSTINPEAILLNQKFIERGFA